MNRGGPLLRGEIAPLALAPHTPKTMVNGGQNGRRLTLQMGSREMPELQQG